jgi:ABC-type multidrug transport system fused ATPase/permease subunit
MLFDRSTPHRDEWRWLLREVRPIARYQVVALIFTIASGALGLLSPLVLKWLIDSVLPNRRWRALAVATALLFGTAALRELANAFAVYLRTIGVERLVYGLRLRLFKQLQRLPAAFHARQPVGDLVQRVERDVGLVGDLGSDIAAAAVRMVIDMSMTIAALLVLDWRLACAIVPLLPGLALVRHHYRTRLQQSARETRDAYGRQSNLLNEALSGAVQIQLLGAEARFARHYARLGLATLKRFLHQRRLELTFAFLSTITISGGTALVVGYGGWRVITGSLSAGGLVAFYTYVANIFTPLNTAVELYSRLNRVSASIRRLIEIENAPDTLEDAAGAVPLTAPPRVVSCTSVRFAYGAEPPTLYDIGLSLRAGERIALVGESGCGKSSLLKLIPRLYDPTEGCLAIDGRDVRSLPLQSLRHSISVVPQDAMLFCGSVRDNLRLGNLAATPDEIARAAAIAGLTEVVDKQPAGWDTMLGPMGSGLSGGEKQRLAIARALIQGRPILVLDEATSALDAASEDRLLTRLESWSAGRIVIVVSHRLAVARWASRVVVLSHGEIVEDGPHERLYRDGTRYHALWQRRGALQSVASPAAVLS